MHFGQEGVPIGDLKETELTTEFVCELSRKEPRERFTSAIRHEQIDIIACTGDFGWCFEEGTLENGMAYLSKLSKELNLPSNRVIVAPGNHDLDRNVKAGEELDKFRKLCVANGFMYSNRTKPAITDVNGIRIISLNTCLGGTVHATSDVPNDFWTREVEDLKRTEELYIAEKIADKIRGDLKHQLLAMDIPAIGMQQLDYCISAVVESPGNTVIILMHHNPIPTSSIDIRRYANIVDSGRLLFEVMQRDKNVIILHGHTHCEAEVNMTSLDDEKRGFVAALGNSGLSSHATSAAALLEIITTSKNDFIVADVISFERNADIYRKSFKYSLKNRYESNDELVSKITNLPRHRELTFDKACRIIGVDPTAENAEKIIMLDHKYLSITRKKEQFKKWRLMRK